MSACEPYLKLAEHAPGVTLQHIFGTHYQKVFVLFPEQTNLNK